MAEDNKELAPRHISIQKIYTKDLSFESPNTPVVFSENWQPETQLNLKSSHREVADGTHEVVLTITVEAKKEDKTLFLIELQQAGLFTLGGIEEKEEMGQVLGSFCPNILYPYAREAIASIVQRGGFPEFLLQPIDFDSLYRQTQEPQTSAAS